MNGPTEIGWQSYAPALDSGVVHRLWRRFVCPSGVHLFDEVESTEARYLYCDACGRTWTAWRRDD